MVFNTSMSGYQEIATDPSYHGQMVTFTYPMIGNYGAAEHLLESNEVHSRAIVVREAKNTAWNATCPEPWVDWLKARGIVGVGGIDTRALTRRIREHGAMTACVAAGPDLESNELLAATRAFPDMTGQDLASAVTCREPYEWTPSAGREAADGARSRRCGGAARLGLASGWWPTTIGMKRSILRRLSAVGCEVTVVPAGWTAEQTLALKPDGVFLSNGPGDPAAVGYAVETIGGLLGKVPVFGICLGHQLLALALGLSTYKLKFGHRGANHPVRDYLTGKVEITSQNHGFAVEPPAVVRRALERGSVVGEGGVAGLTGRGHGAGHPVRGGADHASQPQRRHGGRPAAARPPGVLGAVPSRGRSGTARQPLPVRQVRRSDAGSLTQGGRSCWKWATGRRSSWRRVPTVTSTWGRC